MKSINVDDVLKILHKYGKYIFVTDEKKYSDMVDEITNLKAIEQEPKTGHWIIKDGKEQGYDIAGIKTWYIQIMCDKCGFIKTAIEGHTGQYHYCPHCGAKMVEPQERSE